jgi:transcriptional regulator with XRE-family HTH domain
LRPLDIQRVERLLELIHRVNAGIFDEPLSDLSQSRNGNAGGFGDHGPAAAVSSEPGYEGPYHAFHGPYYPYPDIESNPHMDTYIQKNGGMQKTNVHQILASKLKEIRKARGMSQADVAKKAGYAQSHISRIEKQVMVTGPTIDVLNEIAHALGIEAWELLVDQEATRRAALHRMIVGPEDDEPTPTPPPAAPAERLPKAAVHKRVKR